MTLIGFNGSNDGREVWENIVQQRESTADKEERILEEEFRSCSESISKEIDNLIEKANESNPRTIDEKRRSLLENQLNEMARVLATWRDNVSVENEQSKLISTHCWGQQPASEALLLKKVEQSMQEILKLKNKFGSTSLCLYFNLGEFKQTPAFCNARTRVIDFKKFVSEDLKISMGSFEMVIDGKTLSNDQERFLEEGVSNTVVLIKDKEPRRKPSYRSGFFLHNDKIRFY
jgi:hypothetical protein